MSIKKQICGVIKGINVETRRMTVVGSDETRDRAGDIIRVEGWELDNYMKNPVLLWAHDYSQPPVGKALAVRKILTDTGPALEFDLEFAETDFAKEVFSLYAGGYMRAFSVGFKPLEWREFKDDKGWGYEFTKQELLEFSCVPVPANPNALVAAKGLGLFDALKTKAEEVWGFVPELEQKQTEPEPAPEPHPEPEPQPDEPLTKAVIKAGAVLNKRNKDRLQQAVALIQEVLAEADKDDDADKADEPDEPADTEKHTLELTSELAHAIAKAIADAILPKTDDTKSAE